MADGVVVIAVVEIQDPEARSGTVTDEKHGVPGPCLDVEGNFAAEDWTAG
jgi:hypothetical protein